MLTVGSEINIDCTIDHYWIFTHKTLNAKSKNIFDLFVSKYSFLSVNLVNHSIVKKMFVHHPLEECYG